MNLGKTIVWAIAILFATFIGIRLYEMGEQGMLIQRLWFPVLSFAIIIYYVYWKIND